MVVAVDAVLAAVGEVVPADVVVVDFCKELGTKGDDATVVIGFEVVVVVDGGGGGGVRPRVVGRGMCLDF